jgi:hypothetical protein
MIMHSSTFVPCDRDHIQLDSYLWFYTTSSSKLRRLHVRETRTRRRKYSDLRPRTVAFFAEGYQRDVAT